MKMTILSIETSTQVCSVAISVDGQTVASRINHEGGNHAKLLPLFVEELLAEIGQRGLTLGAVALSEGPGSYTGLRIGASTAKGLCYGMGIPLIPIETTEVLCASLLCKKKIEEGCYLLPMVDARRMEVYTGLYQYSRGLVARKSEIVARVIDTPDAVDFGQKGKGVFFGDGAAKCEMILGSHAEFIADIVPDAEAMGEMAWRRLRDGRTLKTMNEIAYYEPFYLKEFVAAQSHVKGLV